MAEKVNGIHAEPKLKVNGHSSPDSEEVRRTAYISALQSPRITVLVDSTATPFQVPKELLTQHSLPLGSKCASSSTFTLPEVKASTFEDFFIWLHVFEPRLGTKSFEAVLELAVFAEGYGIFHLKNQTSDVLYRDMSGELTPELLVRVYKSVPDGAVLRKLCAAALVELGGEEWKVAFDSCPGLGWDYFVQVDNVGVEFGARVKGPCDFHDHGDVASWERGEVEECPYPHGAPLGAAKMEEKEGKADGKAEVKKANWEGTSGEVTPKPEETPRSAAVSKSEVVPEPELEPVVMTKKEKKNKNRNKKKGLGVTEGENETAADEKSSTSG